MTTPVDPAPDIARARPLSDGEMTAARAVAVLAAALGLLGFVNSFRAVARAAQASFGALAPTVPLGIDLAIAVFSAMDIVLARLDMRPRWVRLVPWTLTGVTIYLNAAGAAHLVRPDRARGVPRAVGGGRVPGRPRDPGPGAAGRRDGDRPDPGLPLAARTAANGPAVAPDGAVGDPFLPGRAGPRADPPARGHRPAGHLRRPRLAVARPPAGPHPAPARRTDHRTGGCPRRAPGPGHRRAGHGHARHRAHRRRTRTRPTQGTQRRRTRTPRRTCG